MVSPRKTGGRTKNRAQRSKGKDLFKSHFVLGITGITELFEQRGSWKCWCKKA